MTEQSENVRPAEGTRINERNAQLAEERDAFIRELMESLPEGYEPTLTPDEARYAAVVVGKATEFRGAYIAQTIQVEQQVNQVLAMIFRGSVQQQELLRHIILERSPGLNFSLKIDLMIEGLKARHQDVFVRFEAQGLFAQLKQVRTLRNKLAHGEDDISPEYIRTRMQESGRVIEEIRLMYWSKGGLKHLAISIPQMQQHFFEVNRVTAGLTQVLTSVHEARKTYDDAMLDAAFPTT